jgi:hypothetical protein
MSRLRFYGLRRTLSPIVESLMEFSDYNELPPRGEAGINEIRFLLVQLVERDDACLLDATPEQCAAILPELQDAELTPPVAFDESRVTPYVRSIYSRELEAVRLAAPDGKACALERAAYSLARIIAAGALDTGHARNSLLQAASPLAPQHAGPIIERAFQKGFKNPRRLPT